MSQVASMEDHTAEGIQWKQLWSLAALYGSIVIGWIAYHNYQPKLLVKFEFTDFTFLLTVAQGLILTITPPIAGKLGDRFRFKEGHRLPIISSGISFAAMVFMAVAFTLLSNPGEVFKWILPLLIVLWLVAMSIFTSPALSTMELFTPIDKLPRAMAILTIVGSLIYALEPVIVDLIDFIGAPATFVAGGVAVFLSGYALKRNSMGLFAQNTTRPRAAIMLDTQKSNYLFIWVLGICLGFATTLLLKIFPDMLQNTLGNLWQIEGKWIVVLVLVVSAAFSIPASNMVNKYGMSSVFWYSVVLVLLSILGIVFFSQPWAIVATLLLFALTFTTLSVSSLPLAIKSANYYEKVFCVGIFFSGVELPEGIIESILSYQ
ncbi:MAG: MFS transporter [Bacteroidota bacterium]